MNYKDFWYVIPSYLIEDLKEIHDKCNFWQTNVWFNDAEFKNTKNRNHKENMTLTKETTRRYFNRISGDVKFSAIERLSKEFATKTKEKLKFCFKDSEDLQKSFWVKTNKEKLTKKQTHTKHLISTKKVSSSSKKRDQKFLMKKSENKNDDI